MFHLVDGVRYSDHILYYVLKGAFSPRVRYSEFGGCPLFGWCECIAIMGEINRCLAQCPLFGRCPLFGVSVNRELTVLATPALLHRRPNEQPDSVACVGYVASLATKAHT